MLSLYPFIIESHSMKITNSNQTPFAIHISQEKNYLFYLKFLQQFQKELS